MKQLTALTVLLRLLVCSCFASCFASSANQQQHHNDDLPLLLTPYIENGKISEGRNLSEVTAIPGLDLSQHLKSYSGYLTINTTTNANTFFWFFPAKVRENGCDHSKNFFVKNSISNYHVFSCFKNRMAKQRTFR